MIQAFFILASTILFAGFLALTRYEARRGSRYFASERAAFDAEIDRWSQVAAHIDLPAFLRHGLRALIARLAHDVAHGSLIAVRFVERLLTRAVRSLRTRRASSNASSGAPSSDFVAAMKDFKQELRNGRKTEETNGDSAERE